MYITHSYQKKLAHKIMIVESRVLNLPHYHSSLVTYQDPVYTNEDSYLQMSCCWLIYVMYDMFFD